MSVSIAQGPMEIIIMMTMLFMKEELICRNKIDWIKLLLHQLTMIVFSKILLLVLILSLKTINLLTSKVVLLIIQKQVNFLVLDNKTKILIILVVKRSLLFLLVKIVKELVIELIPICLALQLQDSKKTRLT